MSQMISVGKELIRINPNNTCQIQYSTSGGRTWLLRFGSNTAGNFIDLSLVGNEIIALTSKGTYYSTNQGRMWIRRS